LLAPAVLTAIKLAMASFMVVCSVADSARLMADLGIFGQHD